ncbi:hypothetical protein HPB51_001811 [Rhipicephalus microplus]|uniref:Nose resistant-to-fluoxetine protein N-terminal domain-containing protein n=1 Tax=Rhipicephalus microplus TaxID=6941 RepID=A0A9J6EVI1_RHIMP|nr:hypothetical protein HPB51_001811 [Rhipicephalus microplus]
MPNSLVSKLLAAEVRPECNKALLRTVRALQSLEPWVLRLIDATGKYPTGFLEASHVDMGAFDQCLETFVRDRSGTVVSRGQYCNLHVYAKNQFITSITASFFQLVYFTKHGSSAEDPLARLALCYIDECNQRDLQALVNAVSVPFFRFEVSNCVTAEPRPWNNTQIAIAIFAGVLLLVIIVSTLADHFAQQQSEWRKNHGLAFQVVQAFSAKSNTELLLYVPSKEQAEQHSLLFLHGIRCLATVHIVAGHLNVMITDSLTRVLSLFAGSTKWQNMLIPAAFNSVDTFFFLRRASILNHRISKNNLCYTEVLRNMRRLTLRLAMRCRMCVPLFFVIMWFYLLPRFVDGPDTEAFFQRFNGELSKHWWMFLVQIRNFYEFDLQDILVYPWYLSADFQLFLVSLLTLLTFRRLCHCYMDDGKIGSTTIPHYAFPRFTPLHRSFTVTSTPAFPIAPTTPLSIAGQLWILSDGKRDHVAPATVGLGVLVWCFVLSYFAFIACEAPTAVLDRLAFGLLTGRASNSIEKHQEQPDGEHSKTVNGR